MNKFVKFFAVIVVSISPLSFSYAETIQNIDITSIEDVKIDTGNKKIIEEGTSALAGAAIGWTIAHYATNYSSLGKSMIAVGGAAAGAYVANQYGTDGTTAGVKITYSFDHNVKNTITVKGSSKEYHLGPAFIIDNNGKKTIHQNSDKIS